MTKCLDRKRSSSNQ